MKTGKITAMLAATTLAVAPTVAHTAAPLSVAPAMEARSGAALSGENDLRGNRSAVMVLGFIILVAIIAVALSNGEGPTSP